MRERECALPLGIQRRVSRLIVSPRAMSCLDLYNRILGAINIAKWLDWQLRDYKQQHHSAASSIGGLLWPSNRNTSSAASAKLVPGPKIA